VGNRIQKLTEGASILGLFVMGALVSKWTTINIPIVVSRIKDESRQSRCTNRAKHFRQHHAGCAASRIDIARCLDASQRGESSSHDFRYFYHRDCRLLGWIFGIRCFGKCSSLFLAKSFGEQVHSAELQKTGRLFGLPA
jgi:hypothetical protein